MLSGCDIASLASPHNLSRFIGIVKPRLRSLRTGKRTPPPPDIYRDQLAQMFHAASRGGVSPPAQC